MDENFKDIILIAFSGSNLLLTLKIVFNFGVYKNKVDTNTKDLDAIFGRN